MPRKIVRFVSPLLVLATAAAPAFASDAPRYEAAPSWVTPAPEPPKADPSGPLFQTLDQQVRISDGVAWSYREIASRAISAEALAQLGTVKIEWQPFHGDLIVHHVDILRDGQRIDLLKAGQKFTVIRREARLEQLELDGTLTATLQVEGLQVGDVLDLSYSVTSKDPALKGGVQANALAPSDPFKVGFARARFLWPTGTAIKWRAYPTGLTARESDKAGWHELAFTLPAPKAPDLPPDAPQRFHKLPAIEASSFADWQSVSKVFAPLYETKGTIAPGSAIAQEVERIKAASPDPKRRVAAALAVVQDRIRYFANGMNGGNYTPQAPAQTWTVGYGDCKAKTLLLLAILHELGIEAEPVTANIGQGDLVPTRLPTPGAFNHIFVHAKVAGEDLWLDGTGRGNRYEDLTDPPPFRWVLPVRAEGAELIQLPFRAPSQPARIVTVDIDQTAGITLPWPFEATVVIRGGAADYLRIAAAQLGKEQQLPFALSLLGGAAGNQAIAVTQKITFDQAAATATVTVTGLTLAPWARQDHRYRFRPASPITGLTLGGDRSRPAWKDIPIGTGQPGNAVVITRVHLPTDGQPITLEGDQTLDFDVAGRHLVRKASLANNVVTIEDHFTTSGIELTAADLPPARTKLAAAQARLLRLSTTTDYSPPYQQIAASKRAHKLDKTIALFNAWVADKPDDVNRYVARGGFYQGIFQWKEASADFDKVVSLDANAGNLFRRAALYEALGEKSKAMADYQAALALEPESKLGINRLGQLQVDAGKKTEALAAVDEHLATADEDKPLWLAIKAEVLARAGDATAAIAALDEAITAKPGDPNYLNGRCWTKGTLDVQIDSALQDCTRAIELAQNNANALDSRALVYFRMKRFDEALADINASLELRPGFPNSLYLRGVIEKKSGKTQAGDADIASARMMIPKVDEDYIRWKITP